MTVSEAAGRAGPKRDHQTPVRIPITIVSDFICPWCLIGHHRLQRALSDIDTSVEAEITWLPFELNPEMPKAGLDRRTYRTAKFGSWARSRELDDGTQSAGAPDGVTFRYDLIQRTPNTFDAHRLSWYAGEAGRQSETVAALLSAYFQQGRDIGDRGILADVASELGFDRAEVASLLESDEGIEPVRDLLAQTHLVVRGVPHIEIDGALIQGAQPLPVFRRVLDAAIARAAT